MTQRSLTGVTLAWETADKNWGYMVKQNGTNVSVTSDGSLNGTHTVNGLKPGTIYEFRVFTLFCDLHSTPYSVVTVTGMKLLLGSQPHQLIVFVRCVIKSVYFSHRLFHCKLACH